MSKGNLFLGYGRGSIGDVVFSRSNGQQVQRARNRNPRNPNTRGQVTQRAYFRTAVKLFKVANEGQFKFAYEDKKSHESDFNAFMRKNLSLAWPSSSELTNSDCVPFNQWIASEGSLPSMPFNFAKIQEEGAGTDPETHLFLSPISREEMGVPSGREPSLGEYYKALIARGVCQSGDIITFVNINSFQNQTQVGYSVKDAVRGLGFHNTQVSLSQIIVDPNNNEIAPGDIIGDGVDFIKSNLGGGLYTIWQNYTGGDGELWESPQMGCVILSRNTAEGLKVSSERFRLSMSASSFLSLVTGGDAALQAVWELEKAAETPVLKGGVANK